MKFFVCTADPCTPDLQTWVSFADLFSDPSAFGLDSETLALVFSFGAAPILFAYLLGYSIALAKGLVRKI